MFGERPEKEGPVEVVGLDQRKLLVRHCLGDPGAFAELIGYFRRPVYTYLVRCGVEAAARDDLFQEIFLIIHRQAARYKAELPLNPWIFSIVANAVRSWYRKQKVQQLLSGCKASAEVALDDNAHHESEARETASWLGQEIGKLTFQQREVLLLCCIKGLRQEDAAQALGMPLNSLKTHLSRARAVLARRLIQRNAKIKHEVSS